MHNQVAITRFGLLRHAETEWNKQKRIQGHLGSPLTPEGRASADQWGRTLKALPFNGIMTSDLERTKNTAEIVNRHLKLPVTEESKIREQHWGQWEGASISEIENNPVFEKEFSAGWHFRPWGGESRLEVWRRSRDALIQAAKKRPGDNLLVVTHEGVIKCLIYRLFERKFLPSEPRLIKPKHLHWLVCRDGRLKIEQINAIEL